jgi:hypothetical protein
MNMDIVEFTFALACILIVIALGLRYVEQRTHDRHTWRLIEPQLTDLHNRIDKLRYRQDNYRQQIAALQREVDRLKQSPHDAA